MLLLNEKASSLRRWANISHSDRSARITEKQAEIIKGEIRRHLALYKLAKDDDVRIFHLLAADALCSTIENPVEVLTEQ